MKIKCRQLFQDRTLQAKMGKTQSFFSRDEFDIVLEVDADGVVIQIQAPGSGLVIVEAGEKELQELTQAGYTFIRGE
jgi:hypothetical protein